VGFFAANAVVLIALYSLPTSSLYVQRRGAPDAEAAARDGSVEGLLWLVTVHRARGWEGVR
jgi:hypothetical protein